MVASNGTRDIATSSRPRRRRSRTLSLTPELFSELDQIARLEAGCVLSVGTFEEMGCWGRVSQLCGDAYVDARRTYGHGSKDDAQHIDLAVEIDVQAFKASHRPEMSWKGVPDKDIFRFILYHEIGHKLNNFCPMMFMGAKLPGNLSNQSLLPRLRRINEVLADRYAWERMYPGKPMPIAVVGDDPDFDKEIAMFSDFAPLRRPTPRPEPTDPWAMIPGGFVDSDDYFCLLGDASDPSSRAGILKGAWRNYPFYVGEGGDGSPVRRIGPFVPSIEHALYVLDLRRGQHLRTDVFEVLGSHDDSSTHRRLNLPGRILDRQQWRDFERGDFDIDVLGGGGGQVWLRRAGDKHGVAFAYEIRELASLPALLTRIPGPERLKLGLTTDTVATSI